MDARYRMPILMTPGVYKIVSVGKQLVPISSLEIHNIRVLMQSGLPIEPCAYLERGQRVEITEGPMRGMVGLLVDTRSAFRIVVSVDAIERSIAVHVERDCVRVLDEAPTCARPATSAPKNRRSESDPALLSKL
jgi:transcription antitermination factor NusG